MMVRASEDDFLAFVLAPPPDETPEDRERREGAEAEARRVSEAIDEQIRQEKIALKKKKKPVKVLLLGQSESDFQLQYARREWAEERASWRAVIHLNLIRNVVQVLDIVAREMASFESDRRAGLSEHLSDSEGEHRRRGPAYAFTDKHRLLKLRLGPLRTVQADLETKLGPGSREVLATTTDSATPFDSPDRSRRPSHEFCVNSSNGWRSALGRLRSNVTSPGTPSPSQRRRDAEGDEIMDVIVGCKNDIRGLWEDPVVQQVLAHRKAKIEDSPGFFLTDVDRIASHDYEPTDHDIVRARLRTVGVQEHRFIINEGVSAGREWLMYDVGGTRSSRATWSWYFDDVDAIIFLCPISCFDEQLREDRRINRLEDSYLLWRSVCSSRILAKTQIILFLNKCDLLHSKIKRGMCIKDHIPSFGDRKNDSITVMKYFQSHFKEISKQSSPEPRPFFMHFTSVVDTKATAATLSVVEESILRTHLRNADLL
ncbi:G-alpha-domain-containing protein [Leucogyrophana mollusca]|uniref:G-alpha-domain-containing protein n=1 Tax=Leucogyrophana mollusca TaxID=85980 RepID=A0ACB8BQU7_9AGAM|nr:G-alpha-domain-containing protein [Leucogyrophana mollusca]